MEKMAVQAQEQAQGEGEGKSWADVLRRSPFRTIVKELEERGSENLTGSGKPTDSLNLTAFETGSESPTGSAKDDPQMSKGRLLSHNQSMASGDDKGENEVASCRSPRARYKEINDENRRHSNRNVSNDQKDSAYKTKEKAGKESSKKVVGLGEERHSASCCSFHSSGGKKDTLNAAFSPRTPSEQAISQRETGARRANLPKHCGDEVAPPGGGDLSRPSERNGVASSSFQRARDNRTYDQNSSSRNSQTFNSNSNASWNQKKTKIGISKKLQLGEKTRTTYLSSQSSGKGTLDIAVSSCSRTEKTILRRSEEMDARRPNVSTCWADITPPGDDTLNLSDTPEGAATEWPNPVFTLSQAVTDKGKKEGLSKGNAAGGGKRVQSIESLSKTGGGGGEGTASTTKKKNQEEVLKRSEAEALKSPLDAYRLVKCLSCGKTFKGYGSLQNHLFGKHDGYNSLSRRAAEAKMSESTNGQSKQSGKLALHNSRRSAPLSVGDVMFGTLKTDPTRGQAADSDLLTAATQARLGLLAFYRGKKTQKSSMAGGNLAKAFREKSREGRKGILTVNPNPAESTDIVRRRGKERLAPRKKCMTSLKKVILREKMQKLKNVHVERQQDRAGGEAGRQVCGDLERKEVDKTKLNGSREGERGVVGRGEGRQETGGGNDEGTVLATKTVNGPDAHAVDRQGRGGTEMMVGTMNAVHCRNHGNKGTVRWMEDSSELATTRESLAQTCRSEIPQGKEGIVEWGLPSSGATLISSHDVKCCKDVDSRRSTDLHERAVVTNHRQRDGKPGTPAGDTHKEVDENDTGLLKSAGIGIEICSRGAIGSQMVRKKIDGSCTSPGGLDCLVSSCTRTGGGSHGEGQGRGGSHGDSCRSQRPVQDREEVTEEVGQGGGCTLKEGGVTDTSNQDSAVKSRSGALGTGCADGLLGVDDHVAGGVASGEDKNGELEEVDKCMPKAVKKTPPTYIGPDVTIRYCKQIISKELNDVCVTVLKELQRLQERMQLRDPVKARCKRRYVIGFREAAIAVKLKRAKAVIVSPNIEEITSEGGLDCKLANILEQAASHEIPVVFALTRGKIGKVFGKRVRMSIVAICDYDGVNEAFKGMVSIAKQGQEDWKALHGEQDDRDLTEKLERRSCKIG